MGLIPYCILLLYFTIVFYYCILLLYFTIVFYYCILLLYFTIVFYYVKTSTRSHVSLFGKRMLQRVMIQRYTP